MNEWAILKSKPATAIDHLQHLTDLWSIILYITLTHSVIRSCLHLNHLPGIPESDVLKIKHRRLHGKWFMGFKRYLNLGFFCPQCFPVLQGTLSGPCCASHAFSGLQLISEGHGPWLWHSLPMWAGPPFRLDSLSQQTDIPGNNQNLHQYQRNASLRKQNAGPIPQGELPSNPTIWGWTGGRHCGLILHAASDTGLLAQKSVFFWTPIADKIRLVGK